MDNTPLLPAVDPTLTESNSTPRSDNSIARITSRQQPERYLFSAEITILYRKEKAYKDKYFIIAYYRDYATKSQLRKNTSGLGTRISDFFRSPSMSADNDIIPFLESLIWGNDKLNEIISKSVRRKYDKHTVSLKTAWYLHINDIKDTKGYRHDFCYSFFNSLTPNDKFFNLMIDTADKSDVLAAIDDYRNNHGLNKSSERDLLFQLRMIWDNVCDAENPFRMILATRDTKQDRFNALRQSTTLKSLSKERRATLKEFIMQHNDPAFEALIELKNCLGLSAAEIGALTWSDYVSVTGVGIHSIIIGKRLGESGTMPEYFADPDKIRVLSPGTKSDNIVKAYYMQERERLKKENIDNATFLTLPVFHEPNDCRKALSKKKVEHLIAIAKNALALPTNIRTLPNGTYKQKVDINKYHGDLFRADLDFALRDAGIDSDEIAYIKGTKMQRTVNLHYRDRNDPISQLQLHQQLNRALDRNIPEELDTDTHKISIRDEQKHTIPGQPARMTTRIELSIPNDANIEDMILSVRCRYGADVTVRFDKGDNTIEGGI